MSTTVRPAYRRSYGLSGIPGVGRDGTDYRDRPSPCICGATFANLGDLMAHPCPADTTGQLPTPDVATIRSDSQDVRPGGGPGSGRRSTRETPNRYPGHCVACQAHVPAMAGVRRRNAAGTWMTVCATCAPDIDRLPEPAPTAPTAPAAAPCRPNRFAADCRLCGGHVPAEGGQLCRTGSRWTVEHNPGECTPAATTSVPAEAPRSPAAALPAVPTGHYAVDTLPGAGNTVGFYRVDRPAEGSYAGRTFVKRIIGGHPDRNVPRSQVRGILERILADGPDVAAARYAQEIGRCTRCNRHLTDDASRAAALADGLGPECRKARS